MIVNQYKPQVPDTGNELHALALMRMQARKDADRAYDRLHKHVKGYFEPEPDKGGFIGSLISSIPVILTGVKMGRKIANLVRR